MYYEYIGPIIKSPFYFKLCLIQSAKKSLRKIKLIGTKAKIKALLHCQIMSWFCSFGEQTDGQSLLPIP